MRKVDNDAFSITTHGNLLDYCVSVVTCLFLLSSGDNPLSLIVVKYNNMVKMILLIAHCKMFLLRSDTSFTSMNNAIIYVTKFYKENFLEFQ